MPCAPQHLLKCSFDVVKRWVNEAQEAASSDNIMVQYHALGLLYHVRKNDRLAVSKMISKFTRHGLKSPFAYCMMIRVASRQLEDEDGRGAKVPSSPGLSRLVPASPEEGLCWPQGLKEPPAGPGRGSRVSLAQVVVVQAISALCQKYPRKHAVLMNFLFSMLREEGGFEYKRAIVDCIISIIEENAESKETGLSHLCEFIEDCEFTVLATRILHLLGQEGPRTSNPSKYIRFIYNRVVLEHAEVRAGAVSALAKFGAQNEEMLPSILVLLKSSPAEEGVLRSGGSAAAVVFPGSYSLDPWTRISLWPLGLTVSIPGLERALQQYTLEPSEKPFDLKSVPLATAPMAEQRTENTPVTAAKQPEKVAATRQEIFQARAPPPPGSASQPLCSLVQFDCTNTLNDQTLENVTVQMEPTEAYEVLGYVPARSLPYNQPGTCYTLVALPKEDPTAVACTFSCMMKFTVKDCDPTTGEADEEGYEDEYVVSEEGYEDEDVLEDLEVTIADHIQKVMKVNFEAAWDEVGDEFEKEETFTLSTIKTLEEAVGNIVRFLGMHPCERSDKVPDNKNTHTLLLAGVFRGGHDILVRSRLLLLDTVTMQVTARSSEELPVDIVLASVG
ncbi:COPG1 [Cervus elaphus hippelaphus]|uniref:COPG1 n=1 Tax=Cervus elaphus hippelaphus TaxID=46360 RepID=A0A212CA55_CEREH|nr:COPG1 [Cervus elaphus hippelaphus]